MAEAIREVLECAITHELMKDPVLVVESGHTYERAAIEGWFARGNTKDPSSNVPLKSILTVTNHTVRNAALAYQDYEKSLRQPEAAAPEGGVDTASSSSSSVSERVAKLLEEADACSFSRPEHAFSLYKQALALKGDSEQANYNIGNCYEFGLGTASNWKLAYQHYKAAADKGYLRAEYSIGRCYMEGIGIPVNPRAGIMWLLLTASRGLPDAKVALGLAMGGVNAREYITAGKDNIDMGDPVSSYLIGLCFMRGLLRRQDSQKGIQLITFSATKGYAMAQYVLGQYFLTGSHVGPLYKAEGIRWLRLAALQGNPWGQAMWALCLTKGDGVERNLPLAEEMSNKARQAGTLYNVLESLEPPLSGTEAMLQGDAILASNVKYSFYFYTFAAKMGVSEACLRLGNFHEFGIGVGQANWVRAFKYYKQAADMLNSMAIFFLGCCYEGGVGTAINEVNAVDLFQKSAIAGCNRAKVALSVYLWEGTGVARNVDLARSMASQGMGALSADDFVDLFLMARCYFHGIGVEKDPKLAFGLFVKSAQRGYAASQVWVGRCCLEGLGTEKKELEGVRWVQKAVDQKSPLGLQLLSHCYQNGVGVPKSEELARLYAGRLESVWDFAVDEADY